MEHFDGGIPRTVKIVEVGPRDGLQNEKKLVPANVKIALIERLANAGLAAIEATAFVSPKWVPQMADNADVLRGIVRKPGVRYAALTPNMKGYEAARNGGADEVAIFAAASEAFSQRNINCSIAESLARFEPVLAAAQADGVPVRGYVSCVVGCPYDGNVPIENVASVAGALIEMGCYEVSLGDTIGVGTPVKVQRMLQQVARRVPMEKLAGHFHDTYGMAIANVHASLQLGMAAFDSSVAGLGGCPYAQGASGNVATEDVIYLLDALGVETGVDMAPLLAAGQFISSYLGRPAASKVARALRSSTAS
ncbi:hydroxymethylglutaryl-CoA lyase [Cupriavidus pauculus]|uniref:hydroxymethylglutaryl-CoA lyase n=1 Tax=Cupriavidus pauculus TaxID=82633 RepID=A0A3G8H9S8_9BURK|nr:hydroxymethylglutaryl-CoA lyase [Cupriavidus pauculus]AZG17224.1 hydroxymethylglutaryl-CoA lyase [Cupriavidus pauculus]